MTILAVAALGAIIWFAEHYLGGLLLCFLARDPRSKYDFTGLD